MRLVSDGSVTNYGFLIDKVIDGITTTNLHWENCSKVRVMDAYNNDPDPKTIMVMAPWAGIVA